jgi:hypothetical protein
VSVAGPGFVEGGEEDSAREEALRKAKIEEDEIVELQKRNWDQPFMTYEPHPSAVGWNKVCPSSASVSLSLARLLDPPLSLSLSLSHCLSLRLSLSRSLSPYLHLALSRCPSLSLSCWLMPLLIY